jgi:hypothetical protein
MKNMKQGLTVEKSAANSNTQQQHATATRNSNTQQQHPTFFTQLHSFLSYIGDWFAKHLL